MRLISYNILDGGVGRADPIGEVLEAQRADVIVLIEATDANVVDRIARRLHLTATVGHGKHDTAVVLSRFPVVHSVNHAALNDASPRALLQVRIEPPHHPPLTLFALHLHARATLADEAKRVDELNYLLAVSHPLREAHAPHLLAGDFNANAPGQRIDAARCKAATRRAYEESGRIPREAVALLLDQGYADSLASAAGDAAFDAATFTTHEPGQRVDYIFTHGLPTDAIAAAWIETDRLATYASDHYPVGLELRLPRPPGEHR